MNLDECMRLHLGGGCNSVVLTSHDGERTLIVDTKYFRSAKELRRGVRSADITIVNTHFHLDHARGNKLYPQSRVISGSTNWTQWDFDTNRSKHPDTTLNPGEEKILQIDDETIHIIDMGKAHSPNDVVVFFEKRKLLAAGDLVWVNMHPVLLDRNTAIRLWIGYLEKLEKCYEIQTVVPGHGELAGKSSLSEMKEYFISISEAIDDARRLRQLRKTYSAYSTFPVFGCFNRTVKLIRREKMATSQVVAG